MLSKTAKHESTTSEIWCWLSRTNTAVVTKLPLQTAIQRPRAGARREAALVGPVLGAKSPNIGPENDGFSFE